MQSCIRHLFRIITQCHDGIRAFGSYHSIGVCRLCVCQSFRKPVRPFARHVLNIRCGRKTLLCSTDFISYTITGRYSSFFASTFQIILAVLLARATAAICLPRRMTTAWIHFCAAQLLSCFARAYRVIILAPWINNLRIVLLPRLLTPSSFCLPPEECSFGVNPRLAANARPFLYAVPSPACATTAVAVMGPIPGIF